MSTNPQIGNEVKTNTSFYIRKNFFFYLLFGSGRCKIFRFAFLISLWYVAGYFITKHYGLWESTEEIIGLKNDVVSWSSFAMDLLMISALFFAFRKLDTLLRRLPKILEPSHETGQEKDCELEQRIEQDIERVRNHISLRTWKSKFWYLIIMSFMAGLVYLMQFHVPLFTANENQPYWGLRPDYPEVYAFASAWTAFHFIIVIGNVLWYLLSMGFTVFPMMYRYAKKGDVRVVPITPDGKGGMAPVGDFSFAMSIIVSTGMIFCVAWMSGVNMSISLIIGASLYVLLVTAIFFGPLLSVHNVMRDAREKDLEWWSELFIREYYILLDDKSVVEGSTEKISDEAGERIAHLSNIDRLYRRVESMPVWPFNFTIVARFFSVILVPLLIAAARILPSMLK